MAHTMILGTGRQASVFRRMVVVLLTSLPAAASAQQPAPMAPPLVFDGVTVVDVEHGTLIPAQRVVIVGNRIQTVGAVSAVELPKSAQVVDARGQYLIPGLWDMHVHFGHDPQTVFDLLLAYGVTGARDMWSGQLDTLRQWRQEIAAGTRIGPHFVTPDFWLAAPGYEQEDGALVVASPERARTVVDSLRAAGADFIKVRNGLPRDLYFAIAREARRIGLPLAGHLPLAITPEEASDSGQHSLEHAYVVDEFSGPIIRGGIGACTSGDPNVAIDPPMQLGEDEAERAQTLVRLKAAADTLYASGVGRACEALAARFRRNDTWETPTLGIGYGPGVQAVFPFQSVVMAIRAGMPILAGSDANGPSERMGPGLHTELRLLVAAGMPPGAALAAATVSPAKYLHAADSLGTITPGKLADLVLLDADPLADITNTTKIRAVVANGRYFDRAALDQLLAQARPQPSTSGP